MFWPEKETISLSWPPQTIQPKKTKIFPWVCIWLKTYLPSFNWTYKIPPKSPNLIWTHRNSFYLTYAHPSPYMSTSMNSNTHTQTNSHRHTYTYKIICAQPSPYINTSMRLNKHTQKLTCTQIYVHTQRQSIPNLFLSFQHIQLIVRVSANPNIDCTCTHTS